MVASWRTCFFVGCAGAVPKGRVTPGPCSRAAVNVRLGLCFTVVGCSAVTYFAACRTHSRNLLVARVEWASCALPVPSRLGGQLAPTVNSLAHAGCSAQRYVAEALFTSVYNYCVRLVGCFSFAGQILPVSQLKELSLLKQRRHFQVISGHWLHPLCRSRFTSLHALHAS